MLDFQTPIYKLFTKGSNEIFIKREDLIPFSFGGNKVRIAEEFFKDMEQKGCNCIIGYGNARSNLCRVIANKSASLNIPCHIISPDEDDGSSIVTTNSTLVRESHAIIHPCSKSFVANTVESVFHECSEEGYRPYYIYGDKYGKGNEATPVAAYDKVYKELIGYDYIFLATGTGMTQAGLLAGQAKFGGHEQIVGISVARNAENVSNNISSYLSAAKAYIAQPIIIDDNFRMGGYGRYGQEIMSIIKEIYSLYGLPLDPVYTGKAFYGMLHWLKKIHGKKVLFLHTGGTPLFFDFIHSIHQKDKAFEVKFCTEIDQLISFLVKIDSSLPIRLSDRVNIEEYALKILNNGKVLKIERDQEIISAALFYDNDTKSQKAYLSLLGTLPEFGRFGFASLIMNVAEQQAKMNGMKEFWLETERENTTAISFYSKRGFQIDSLSKKILMRKTL